METGNYSGGMGECKEHWESWAEYRGGICFLGQEKTLRKDRAMGIRFLETYELFTVTREKGL